MDQETILEKKRKIVKMSKIETLLILRAYQANPTSWSVVLDDVLCNTEQLPIDARQLYEQTSKKKLKDRMSSKFGKLLALKTDSIKNLEIRNEVAKIKTAETRMVERTGPPPLVHPDRRDAIVNDMSDDSDGQQAAAPPRAAPPAAAPPAAAPAPLVAVPPAAAPQPAAARLVAVPLAAIPGPAAAAAPLPVPALAPLDAAQPDQQAQPAGQRRKKNKRPLSTIIRENQEAYNKFITKKVPKILRELGISSSDDD